MQRDSAVTVSNSADL